MYPDTDHDTYYPYKLCSMDSLSLLNIQAGILHMDYQNTQVDSYMNLLRSVLYRLRSDHTEKVHMVYLALMVYVL